MGKLHIDVEIDLSIGEMDEIYCLFYSCPSCNADRILEDSKYCLNCGAFIKWAKEKPPEPDLQFMGIKNN